MSRIAARNGGLRAAPPKGKSGRMDAATRDLLRRTEQPRYANGERKLARDLFMQATWVLLAAAALAQLILLLALDVMS